jgi:hypothetical protein
MPLINILLLNWYAVEEVHGIEYILIIFEKSVFETVFIVDHVLKVLLVPKCPFYNENRILKCEEYSKTHKRKKTYTTGILLSGFFVLLRIVDFLESCNYDIDFVMDLLPLF